MFLITQFIGLYVLHANPFHITAEINGTTEIVSNPVLSFVQPPEIQQESDFSLYFGSIIFALIFAVIILFLLAKFKTKIILKIWFFIVVIIALFITFNAVFSNYINSFYFWIPALVIAAVLSYIKIYRQNFLVHNLTELFIYPGIASVFVPILNFWTVLLLLILISIYDIWAVWHSGIMQKMAKYQMNELKIFGGFFVPYISRKLRMRLNKMKKSKRKKTKIKVNLAILGGGDVIYPLMAAGVVLTTEKVFIPFTNIQIFQGGFIPALFVIAGATLGLGYLLCISEKKKFYPAMPFITAGVFIGLILSYIISLIF